MSIANEIKRINDAVHGDSTKTAGTKGSVSRSLESTAVRLGIGTAGDKVDVLAEEFADITAKAATTYNVSSSARTVSAGQYLSGDLTIRAVRTSNISAENVKDGVTITVGDAADTDRLVNVTGTFTDASTVSSGQTAAGASDIRSGKSAWVDGAEVKGSMANASITLNAPASSKKPTITQSAKGASETWTDAGSGGTIVRGTTAPTSGVYVKVSSAANTASYTPTATVGTQGYTDKTSYTGTVTTVGAAASDVTYVPITTTSASVSGNKVTYGTGWITGGSKTVADGTITSGDGSIAAITPSYNATNGNFDTTVTGSIAAPTVGTAGYVSSTVGTKNTNTTVSSTAKLTKIAGSTSITGTKTYTPTITRSAKGTSETWTDAGSGGTIVRDTAPESGVYVKVSSAANTGSITATPSVTTSGYGTSANHGISGTSATVGASASKDTYIPITTTSASVSGKTVTYGTGWITGGSKSVSSGSVTSGAATVTNVDFSYNTDNGNFDTSFTGSVAAPTVGTAGYVSSSDGTKSGNTTVNSDGASVDKIAGSTAITGTTTKKPSITKSALGITGLTDAADGNATTTAPTADSTNKVWVKVSSAASTGTLTATPSVTTPGYGTSTNHGISGNTATVGASASDATYIPIKEGAYSASVNSHSISTTPVVTPSIDGDCTIIGITTTTKPSGTDGTDYWTIDPSGSVTTTGKSSTKATATIGTAGYIAAGSKTTTSASTKDITPTVAAGTNRYLPKSTCTVSGGALSTNMEQGGEGETSYYVDRAIVYDAHTAGYTPAKSATSIIANSKVYIKPSSTGSAVTNDTSTATVTLDPGKQVTIGKGYYGSDRIIRATIADEAGESVSADGYSLAVTDKTAAVSVGTYNSTNKYYPITTSLTGTFSASTPGWFSSGSATDSSAQVGTMAKATSTISVASNPAASILNQPSASASVTLDSNLDVSDTSSSTYPYSISASASANSGNSTASCGKITHTDTAGYLPATSGAVQVAAAASATSTAVSKSDSAAKYIRKGELNASCTKSTNATAGISANGFTAADSNTAYYVSLTTSAGTAYGSASVKTPGYVISETANTSSSKTSIPVTVTDDITRINIPVGATPKPTITVSSGGLITSSQTTTTGFITGGTVSETKQLTTKAATTITPTNAEQTAVSAGTYCTGAIKVAAVNYYYTSTSAPTSSDGGNGDIWLVI